MLALAYPGPAQTSKSTVLRADRGYTDAVLPGSRILTPRPQMATDHERLVWLERPKDEFMPHMDRWFTGTDFHRFPTKAPLRNNGLSAIVDGWRPPDPVIHPETRVFAMGS